MYLFILIFLRQIELIVSIIFIGEIDILLRDIYLNIRVIYLNIWIKMILNLIILLINLLTVANADCNLRGCAVWSPCCKGYQCQALFQVCGKANCPPKVPGEVEKGCGCKKDSDCKCNECVQPVGLCKN